MYKNKKIKSLEEKIKKNQKLREQAVTEAEKPFIEEYRKLKAELNAEVCRTAIKNVGKCYVSINRYLGLGVGFDSCSWKCYDKIIDCVECVSSESGYHIKYKVLHFEKSPEGIKCEINIRYGSFGLNHTEITNEEFNKAFEEIKKELP